MNSTLKKICGGTVSAFAAAVLLALVGPASAQTPEGVQMTQASSGYIAGSTLVITCTVTYPAGQQLRSLLWTPALPPGSDWTLVSASGNGSPVVDPDGAAVLFQSKSLGFNPLVFQYTVRVPLGEHGERSLGGTLDYQLAGMPNPLPISPAVTVLTDADATHASIGYMANGLMTVNCTFSRPAGVQLRSLLWYPELPDEWTLTSVAGNGTPLLSGDGEVVFRGDLSASTISFSYTVSVPPGATGPTDIGGIAEYQFAGMANTVTVRAKPDPLTVLPMHTLRIGSAYGAGQPAVGLYTNYYGTALTNRMSASATVGAYTYACAGWLLTGNEPVTGTGTECLLTLTNNAVLTWVWVAPAVANKSVNEMETLSFQAAVSYTEPAYPALALTYSLDATSVSNGMALTEAGAFTWTPTEAQGGQTHTVTVTVTDSGAEPHWLTASETFTITVAEVNRPPALDPLSSQLADEQSTLTFTATASDPDVPVQNLTFSLDNASFVSGMRIDPTTGVFSWTPAPGQAGTYGQSYTVQVSVSDGGLSDTKSFIITVADSRGEHATAGYLEGRTAEIVCSFSYPASRPLRSLLWTPQLPPEWTLLSVTGDGNPKIDVDGLAVVFTGSSLTNHNPVVFRYLVNVPDGVTGPQSLRAVAEYQVTGMANPVSVYVNPDPLPIPELHTFEVVSVQGSPVAAVGVYTNLHGTVLSNTINSPLTIGTRTFACTGWTLTGVEPATGSGHEVSLTLTHDAVLTWTWVAPLIAPPGTVSVSMAEDGSPITETQFGITASEPYRPALEAGLAWSLFSGPTHGTATVSATVVGTTPDITYAPATNYFGGDSFVVQVADGLGGFDKVNVEVTVGAVNDAPVLAYIGPKRTDERTPLTFTVSATDVESPPQALTYRLDAASVLAGMAIGLETGVFTWTPLPGQAGLSQASFPVTVTVTDNGTAPANQSDSEAFTVTLDSSRATHVAVGYVADSVLEIRCTFAYPAGRQLRSLMWTPELPDGTWTLLAATGEGRPEVNLEDGAVILKALTLPNPVTFTYTVRAPAGATGLQPVGGAVDYQLNGMANVATLRAQPDPLLVPMLLTLSGLAVGDKVYDGATNATVTSYGTLVGVDPGHSDVALVYSNAAAFFDTPQAGTNKTVTVSGLALSGADASLYGIVAQTTTADITARTLTVGGSFTAENETYNGTVAATILVNALTLVNTVGADAVTLNAIAAFDDPGVGAGKPVRLTAASGLSGAAAGNYTLSLAGAPATTADILFPAVSGTQACDGFHSPSSGKSSVSNSFAYPAGETLASLTWTPVLPTGWTIHSVAGNGSPSVSNGTNIVFQAGSLSANPLVFSYKLVVPAGQAVTNTLNARVTFGFASMTGTLTAENLPAAVVLKRYHSADCSPANWKISSTELAKVTGYLNAGVYYRNPATSDGFSAASGTQNGGHHSADCSPANWKISSVEWIKVKAYLNAGDYHVSPGTSDGYAAGP